MAFSSNYKARAWMVTIHISNMEKVGLTKEQYSIPEQVANYFTALWNDSGKDRTSGIAVCLSSDGCYHAHMACYGNSTTLKNVAKTLGDSHVEPQLGGKAELTAYLRKEGSYAEKQEQVLFTKDIENIQDAHGKRSDLDIIDSLIKDGLTPEQIFQQKFAYRKYEKMIKSAFLGKRLSEAPLTKDLLVEYHFGASGTGKTHVYNDLCEINGREKVYLVNDLKNGGFDYYLDRGAPPILFIDDLKPLDLTYKDILNLTDKYSDLQTHCRFKNIYNLWTTIIITSVFPPEILYENIVEKSQRKIDSFEQLKRRITNVVFHYIEHSEYKTFSISAEDYTNQNCIYEKVYKNGFVPVKNTAEEIPFK